MAVYAEEMPQADIADHSRVVTAVKNRASELACVTPQAFYMASAVARLCAAPSPAVKAKMSPHDNRYIKVYVTPDSKQTLLTGKGVYPVGTLIVKEKCRDREAMNTELFTAMLKREQGYNPTAGDWEFILLDREANLVACDKSACMKCHQRFGATDFVSRVYVQGATANW